ncbi:uncharacterized protein LOC116251581 [Nymphaea colorata]|uniref:Voltage-gated hydrogen channel 1 n=1 Tax=Nymphaea colorata TaxID=210225 RepID=A0A5K1BCF6_9MAGN|nr:uncharacterized protein LOC116251581 [Nymphaea colorata]
MAPRRIDIVEVSVENLQKNWQRRQWWESLFKTKEVVDDREASCSSCQWLFKTRDAGDKGASWRTGLASLLQSTPAHAIVLVFLLLDLVFTVISISSCPSVPRRKGGLFWGGIAILITLIVKDIVVMVVLGLSFFKHAGYVMEITALVLALCLEIFLKAESAGLLVLVNSWRVVRMIQSIFGMSDEAIETQITNIESQFEDLRVQTAQMEQLIRKKNERIAELENGCHNQQRPRGKL